MQPPQARFDGAPPREKILNAPPVVVAIAASMPILYLMQARLHDQGYGLAFAPVDLAEGRYAGLVLSLLLHGGWTHVAMNAVGALAFGAPVARLLRGGSGLMAFLALYIVSGVLANLGYGLLHLGATTPVVGASGAVFALIGAATRLLGGRGRVLALTDRRVLSAAAGWMAVNAAVGLIGFAPGADGARIAWEAHAVGFVVGILAIGPLGRMFAPPRGPWDAPEDGGFDSRGGMGDPRA